MKYIACLACCLFSCILLKAQMMRMRKPDSFEKDKAVQVYMGIGGAYNNYKNLNNRLENFDLPKVGKFSLAGSLEADIRNKNFLIGLTGSMGYGFKRPDDYNVMLLNFVEQLNIAYYVANTRKFHFAPQVGVGFFSSDVSITQRKDIDGFNGLLQDRNSVSINQSAAVLDFCLRFDFADFSKPISRAGSIKVGYKYGFSKRGWGADAFSSSTVNNSPEDRINQVYIMFSTGLSLLKPVYNK